MRTKGQWFSIDFVVRADVQQGDQIIIREIEYDAAVIIDAKSPSAFKRAGQRMRSERRMKGISRKKYLRRPKTILSVSEIF